MAPSLSQNQISVATAPEGVSDSSLCVPSILSSIPLIYLDLATIRPPQRVTSRATHLPPSRPSQVEVSQVNTRARHAPFSPRRTRPSSRTMPRVCPGVYFLPQTTNILFASSRVNRRSHHERLVPPRRTRGSWIWSQCPGRFTCRCQPAWYVLTVRHSSIGFTSII